MNLTKLFLFLAVGLSVVRIQSMELPPPNPNDWNNNPEHYAKPLPARPQRPQGPLPARPRAGALVPPTISMTTPAAVTPTMPVAVQLSENEKHSIAKIEGDIDGIIDNLLEILKRSAVIGGTAVAGDDGQVFSAVLIEGFPMLANIGSAGLLIANILKHSSRLSKASPEVKVVAQERLRAKFNSERYVNTVQRFERFAANSKVPGAKKLAVEMRAFPERIINTIIKNK